MVHCSRPVSWQRAVPLARLLTHGKCRRAGAACPCWSASSICPLYRAPHAASRPKKPPRNPTEARNFMCTFIIISTCLHPLSLPCLASTLAQRSSDARLSPRGSNQHSTGGARSSGGAAPGHVRHMSPLGAGAGASHWSDAGGSPHGTPNRPMDEYEMEAALLREQIWALGQILAPPPGSVSASGGPAGGTQQHKRLSYDALRDLLCVQVSGWTGVGVWCAMWPMGSGRAVGIVVAI